MKRRSFLSRSLAGGAILGSGLLSIKDVFARWPRDVMVQKGKDSAKAIKDLLGDTGTDSADIKLKAPEVAENGAVVPVDVDATAIDNVENITIVIDSNPRAVAASFNIKNGAVGFAATRVKMGKTGNIIAFVKAGGKVFKAGKEVKVTIGGCGG